jgi:3-methyladenine DNA glycosylase AlkC/ASC-1-like (ASCH) protein
MTELLKDNYTEEFISILASKIHKHYTQLNQSDFIEDIFANNWNDLELKDRMGRITGVMYEHLPKNYPVAIEILKKSVKDMDKVSEHGGYLCIFFPDYVEQFGLEYWDISIDALEYFTIYYTAEFAVRPFIKQDTNRMMQQMLVWSQHDNHHVRRLASEGCRSRLPWSSALPDFKKDPTLILPILENLKNDDSEYVRRSVANNLNDIAKDNPNITIELANRWYGHNNNMDKLVKHACRSLLKSANSEALSIFGYADYKNIKLDSLSIINGYIKLGDNLEFCCELDIAKQGKYRIEYAVDYVKANGKNSRKIFQLKEANLPAKIVVIKKKQSFKNMTTRKHYSGMHNLAILVNGQEIANKEFSLLP